MRELNRLGITSAIDAGGGFQNYPEDYQVIEQLRRNGELTVRIAYNLFTQKPKSELADFEGWGRMVRPGQGDDYLRHNGAGEMLVFSAADFEDFLEPRPDLPGVMESELKAVVSLLAGNRWPFRLHATYDETIARALNVYEEVNREIPLAGFTHSFLGFSHGKVISDDRSAPGVEIGQPSGTYRRIRILSTFGMLTILVTDEIHSTDQPGK
jgi:predicted amidohydrolase YtcJ